MLLKLINYLKIHNSVSFQDMTFKLDRHGLCLRSFTIMKFDLDQGHRSQDRIFSEFHLNSNFSKFPN
jgi:hypothetical protein